MGNITLKQAALWCGGTVEEKYENISFFGASNDTRTIQSGQLFIALQGTRDGHEFIEAAMEKGAAAVLCSRKVGDFPAIVVEDTRIALGQIAREERKRLGLKVVGITGSVGKSTTKEMVAAVLEGTYRVGKTPVNHNNAIGMPMAILGMADDTQIAVIEMGMNHFREMAYLSTIAQPDISVIVNIGTMHIEFLGTMEGIRQAKLEILEGMRDDGLLILNGDDFMLRHLEQRPIQKTTYYGAGENCAVRYTNVQQNGGELTFDVETSGERFCVKLALEGKHFVSDAMAAITVGLTLGVSHQNICHQLEQFQNMKGRQQIFEKNGFTIIEDCYNAGPESMEAALNVMGQRSGRRVAILGEMLELGWRAPAEHYRIGRIAAEKVNVVIAYGPNAERIYAGCITGGMSDANVKMFTDKEALILCLKRMAKPGDTILFKGSRGMHMETIMEAFLKGSN